MSPRSGMLQLKLTKTSISQQILNMGDESQLKCEERPTKSSRNEMLIFGLRSTSNDHPNNLNDESQLKCKKMAP